MVSNIIFNMFGTFRILVSAWTLDSALVGVGSVWLPPLVSALFVSAPLAPQGFNLWFPRLLSPATLQEHGSHGSFLLVDEVNVSKIYGQGSA